MRIESCRRYAPLVAAIVLAALCQFYIVSRSPIIAKDGMAFIRIAKSLAVDPVATLRAEDQHPGYPAMLLAFERGYRLLTGREEFDSFIAATHLASGTCGLLVIVFLWLFARGLYNDRVANVTVLLAAVWPLFRLNASDSLSDTPHLMFYLAGAWMAVEGLRTRHFRWLAGAGLASSLAFAVRPEGLLVGLAAGLAVAWEFCRVRFSPRKVLLAIAGVAAAGSLLVVPYAIVAGKITTKKLPFHRTITEHERAMAAADRTTGLLAEPAPGGTLPDEFSRPSAILGVVALAVVELGRELAQGFYYLALIPLTAGTFARSRQRPNYPASLMHVVLMNSHAALLLLLYLTAGYISHRHVMPLVALMLPTAAAGTIWLADEASRRLAFVGSPRRSLAVAVALFYVGLVPKCLVPLHAVYAPLYQAAELVKREARPGDSVLASSSYVRFYAGLPGIVLGSEAPNLPIGLHFAPDKVWPFIVLEVDERSFDRELLCGSTGPYDQILELPAHPRKPWSKVLVFRARSHDGKRLEIAGRSAQQSN